MSKMIIPPRSGPVALPPTASNAIVDKALVIVLAGLAAFYAISSLTLPLADDLWLGEAPILALVQLPKIYLENQVQGVLITVLRNLGLGSGSPSPDMIATQPWAFAILFVLPSGICIAIVALLGRLKQCRAWVVILLVATTIDAVVTIWFDQTSRLSLF